MTAVLPREPVPFFLDAQYSQVETMNIVSMIGEFLNSETNQFLRVLLRIPPVRAQTCDQRVFELEAGKGMDGVKSILAGVGHPGFGDRVAEDRGEPGVPTLAVLVVWA